MGINREIRYETAGDSTSMSQVFYNNYLADSRPVQTSFVSFSKPMFITYGGTLNYYSQDPYAIFTNLVRPPIRFQFSANTSSLTGDSYFVHDIYRLDYDVYRLYGDNQIDNSQSIVNKSVSNTDGLAVNNQKTNSPSRDLVSNSNLKMGNNAIPVPEKFFGQNLTTNDLNTIQQYFKNPVVTITGSTSGITGNIYDLYVAQYVKQYGNLKTDLFTDKAQFFIQTKIVFNVDLNRNYSDFYNNSVGLKAVPTLWNNSLKIVSTNSSVHNIAAGPFKGIEVIGDYFTYFIVPDKPKLEYPVMSGQLTTFTPEFRWSNGEKADSFVIQINYNTGDTTFSGTVFNYPVEKNEKNSKVSNSKVKGPSEEFSTQKTVYNFQIPMKSNKSFIYRVGNSKEILDIFNVRRVVVTFSDYYAAISQPEAIKTYVVTESDSKYDSQISGYKVPPSLDYESEVAEYVLSGQVSGSTVTGATMQLTYPNSSFVTTTTDLTGNYSFTGLEAGTYTLTTNYRGYQEDVRSVVIAGNVTENFKIKLIWGNQYDTWGKMASENYYT